MTMTRQCMSCGHHGMVHNEDDQETLSFNGETVALTGLAGWFCPSCGEGELDPESSKRYAVAHDDLIHRARTKQREDIGRIRRKLRLTQTEAAKITGGGRNAFSRYEWGGASPMPAVLNLLRLLDNHPVAIAGIEP
ncbi:type II toxin-antitoxin system MqsA family antitoxin [Acidithiobacillus thiooxidans]|uniref:Antitoxin MqsA n=1 Tax=Acidithiobacillus thiooxidans ATCC 19377 TaxID=637390 RepID=A0A543Q3K3_ACITH|nr:type II toxin-antitoxin system MqsA family antitoxin [Acidithiobacillus thiooxidans]MDX5934968.1 type II toxin-antitoxin system MqsA family antitoxin [Acidithiobacillus thiooxidans]TQN50906.1 Antitoxin MqsA [Acidithiobacillus thiooxidans ATCC 19377]